MKKKNKDLATPKTPRPRSRPQGTAVLGRVIPELAISGMMEVTDADALFIANSIAKSILMQFEVDLLQAAGLLGNSTEEA